MGCLEAAAPMAAAPRSAPSMGATLPPVNGRSPPKEHRQYMRSASDNPWAKSPALSEHPADVVRKGGQFACAKGASDPSATGPHRPVNRRGYFSPSFWVREVEEGETSRTATYIDYGLSNGFHKFWQDECHKEEWRRSGGGLEEAGRSCGSQGPKRSKERRAWEAAQARSTSASGARRMPAIPLDLQPFRSLGGTGRARTALEIDEQGLDNPTNSWLGPPPGRPSLARMTSSRSSPCLFRPEGPHRNSAVTSWRP